MNTRNTLKKLSIAIALVALAAGILYGGQRRKVQRMPVKTAEQHNGEKQTLQTKNGKTIVVTAEGNVFTTDVPDGTYKLTNNGAVRVRGGKVVWDAFGTVRRLRAGSWRGFTDPTG